jgi:uncharacterized membrane protein YeaQ/YmgE (transglycosylase-associated protein family)
MGILSWIIFGALAGWVASMIVGTNERQGCLGNVFIGVIGAFLGGFLVELFSNQGMTFGWDWRSFIVAVIGAVLLLTITGWYRKRR